jgi:hypothetical protein
MEGITRMQYIPIRLVRKMVREDIMPSSSGEPLDALEPFPSTTGNLLWSDREKDQSAGNKR